MRIPYAGDYVVSFGSVSAPWFALGRDRVVLTRDCSQVLSQFYKTHFEKDDCVSTAKQTYRSIAGTDFSDGGYGGDGLSCLLTSKEEEQHKQQ
jgi:hypothetical protein